MKLRYALALPLAALFILPATLSASATPTDPSVLAVLPADQHDTNQDIALCDGSIFAPERLEGAVAGITPAGVITTFALATGALPEGVACSPDNRYVYTYDAARDWLSRIDLVTGTVDDDFASVAADNGGIRRLIVDPSGNIYIPWVDGNWVDSLGEEYLARVSPSGAIQREFADLGGYFDMPHANLALAGGDFEALYFSDGGNDVVNGIEKVSTYDGSVTRFDSTPPKNAGMPQSVAVDSNGNVYEADHLGTILKYASDGSLLNADVGTFAPTGVQLTVDKSDNLYVTADGLRAVYKITPDGHSSEYEDFSEDTLPAKSLVSSDGVLYTLSTNDDTIYQASGPSLMAPPHITSAAPFRAYTATHFTYTVTSISTAVKFTVANGSLPAGFTLDASTGVMSSPTVTATPGIYKFDIVATNPWGSDIEHVTFQVIRNVY
jgi:sugar lactone lactonase YvrE